jgi:dynein heavy chain
MATQVESFSHENGQPQLLFFFQNQQITEIQRSPEPVLFSPNLETDRLEGRCIYFVRTVAGDINPDQFEADVSIGEFSPPLFETIDLLLSELHGSILHSRHYDWNGLNEDSIRVCLSTMDQLLSQVQQTVSSLYGGMKLAAVEQWLLEDDRAKNETWNKLALDDHTFHYLSTVLEEWCLQVEILLQENDIVTRGDREIEVLRSPSAQSDGKPVPSTTLLGPRTEVAWWRKRSASLGSVVEQLKGHEAKVVLSVTGAGKAKAIKRWRERVQKLNETYADAKENVRLLADVDKYLEPLYSGTSAQIQAALPDLFAKFRVLTRETRHYKSRRRIERFLSKTANQLISACRRLLQNRGKLFEQEPARAIESVDMSSFLCTMFRELVLGTKERLTAHSKSKAYDFSTQLIFANMDIFEVRLSKVKSMLVTIEQFLTLEKAGIDELDVMYLSFKQAVEYWKTRPYDMLDFLESGTAFDGDYDKFTANITSIEVSMRDYITQTFDEVQNIEFALDLLSKLEVILQRDSLKGDLEDKYSLIFQFYGDELEKVQMVYDGQKTNPPISRNLPPVAGNILWARHLLTKIEEPMQRFQSNRVVLAATESKKIIRLFNRVARTLIEFETLWYQAWCDSIEAAKSGLQATLLVR